MFPDRERESQNSGNSSSSEKHKGKEDERRRQMSIAADSLCDTRLMSKGASLTLDKTVCCRLGLSKLYNNNPSSSWRCWLGCRSISHFPFASPPLTLAGRLVLAAAQCCVH